MKKSKSILSLTVLFLGIVIALFAGLLLIQKKYLAVVIAEHPLVVKLFPLIGFSSIVMIVITAIIFQKMRSQMPVYFLTLTVFKLGVFFALIVQAGDLDFDLRIAILIPILLFLLIEKVYAYFLFQALSEKKDA